MGARNTRVVVVGKDFAAAGKGWVAPNLSLATNKNLIRLIGAAGLDAARDVYLTNAVLCMKPGDEMSAALPAKWVENCSRLLRRTIEIVSPWAVAALGGVAWQGLGHAFGIRLPRLSEAVERGPLLTTRGLGLFAFNHCGGLGSAHRNQARQMEDWKRLGEWLEAAGREAA